jgi:hypothetical protein
MNWQAPALRPLSAGTIAGAAADFGTGLGKVCPWGEGTFIGALRSLKSRGRTLPEEGQHGPPFDSETRRPSNKGQPGSSRWRREASLPTAFRARSPGSVPEEMAPGRGAVPDTTFGCRPRIPIKQDGEIRPSGEGGSSYASGLPRRGRMGGDPRPQPNSSGTRLVTWRGGWSTSSERLSSPNSVGVIRPRELWGRSEL